MKKMFEFKTKTIVATAIGAALFTLLMLYVKIPTGIPETDIQTCYGVGSFFAAMFGPVAGFLIGFIGHAISDATYGAPGGAGSYLPPSLCSSPVFPIPN